MKLTVSKFLKEYKEQYGILSKRTDDGWKNVIDKGEYCLNEPHFSGFFKACAAERKDYFSSDKEAAACILHANSVFF